MSKISKPHPDSKDSIPHDGQPDHERDRAAHDESKRREAEDAKATQFDGNPNPVAADRSPLKPKDDTPATLDKKSGPRTGKA
ncbi:MAG TPA: hypothetical protein DEB15_04990 [Pusillimonas sp.]|jgi:hypothetical protein|nr:hypothetical protein [Pusillimonas sp.]|tara:strand:- start:72678 stop:72923 length:246 start_codon:yes stop_codon:yes gene_type:complete